jgi:hypothetical protein
MLRLSFYSILLSVPMFMAVSSAQEQKISLKFLAFPQVEMPKKLELLTGKEESIEIETPGNELSQPYKVTAIETIIVGKTIQNEKNENVFHEYGRAKSLGVPDQIILLIRKGTKESDGFTVIPVDGALAKFKGASYLFMNVSKVTVGGLIGDQKFGLKPNQSLMLKPKPNHEANICQVTLAYLSREKWKTFYDTRWPANDKFRSLVFFYQDPKTGRLGVAPIIDIIPFRKP